MAAYRSGEDAVSFEALTECTVRNSDHPETSARTIVRRIYFFNLIVVGQATMAFYSARRRSRFFHSYVNS